MLKRQLTETEMKCLKVFSAYIPKARMDYLRLAGFGPADLETLVQAGYLVRNKLGHLRVTREAELMLNGGKTNAELRDEYQRRAAAARQAAWDAAFGGAR